MKHSFHCHLQKSFRWYHNWHDHPRHGHSHWAFFAATILLVFSFLSGEIFNFYLENEYQAQAQAGLTLGVSGDRFTLNGTPQFLLFVSYFDAMDASDATLDSDLSRLRSLGFNGIRIWPTWAISFTNPSTNQLMDVNGNLRPGMLNRLINIIQKARNNSLIVDVSFSRTQIPGLNVSNYRNGIVSTTQGLIPHRNLYFDIHNEADHPSGGLTPIEARQIRDAVKAADPQRIVSVSLISNSNNEPSYVINGGMDFHPTHGGIIGTGNGAFITQEKNVVPGLPVHQQEPDRCRSSTCTGFGGATYTANDFFTSAQDAKCAGAAGWNFHTSGGYDLRNNNTLFNWAYPQNAPAVENAVANGLNSALASTTWFSCTGGPIPPPPPPPPIGPPPYGFPFECPAGYITLARSNASTGDPTETAGWYADEDSVFPEFPLPLSLANNQLLNGATFPVNGLLVCTGSGTAFLHDGSWWPANCRPSPGGVCQYDPTQPLSASNNPGWEIIGGRPYKNGIPVQFIAEMNCSAGSRSLTIPNRSVMVGGFTSSTGGARGTLCVQGTDASVLLPPPPLIYYAFPSPAQFGGTLLMVGERLVNTVEIFDSNRSSTVLTGNLNATATEVTISIPNFAPGNYTVRVGTGSNLSNEIPFQIIPGIFVQALSPLSAPVITGLNPVIAAQGAAIEIIGSSLTPNVQFFDSNNIPTNITGTTNSDFTITTVTIPFSLLPGIYTVGVTGYFGSAVSQDVLTVLEGSPGVTAQSGPLSLPTTQSTFEDLISSAFNYSIILVGIAVFIMVMWGGFLWLTSAANPSNISRAKGIIFNAILGAVLLVSAYVILYTINPELVGGPFTLPGIGTSAPPIPPPPGPPPPGGQIDACSACSVYPGGITAGGQPIQCTGFYIDVTQGPAGIQLNNTSRTCPFANILIAQNLVQLKQLYSSWVVSEGFPPFVNHADICHGDGSCVDISVSPRPSSSLQLAQAVDNLCAAANQAGFNNIINEYSSLSGFPYNWLNCPQPRSTPFQTGDHLHIRR
ncbi:MAG: pilin [Candidatus Taylorbacteria bacterium]|nr:pilin [Candidatus Taylorbacteria bacterium]